jgi:hypothetical protein
MDFLKKRELVMKLLEINDIQFAQLNRIKGMVDKIHSKIIIENQIAYSKLLDENQRLRSQVPTKSEKVVNTKMARTNSGRRAIEKIDPATGEILEKYPSLRLCCKENKINHTTLYIHIRKTENEPINGYIYKFAKYEKKCRSCGIKQNKNNSSYTTAYNDNIYFNSDCKKCKNKQNKKINDV